MFNMVWLRVDIRVVKLRVEIVAPCELMSNIIGRACAWCKMSGLALASDTEFHVKGTPTWGGMNMKSSFLDKIKIIFHLGFDHTIFMSL